MNQLKLEKYRIVILPILVLCFLALGACEEQGPEVDTTPPAAVTDLAATRIPGDQATVRLTWKAVGDDVLEDIASKYDLRFAPDQAILFDWVEANQVPNMPGPLGPGTPQSVEVGGLNPDENLYFAIKVADDAGHWSAISNIAQVPSTGHLPPPAIDDLASQWLVPGQVQLSWRAVGSNVPGTDIVGYDIRYSGLAINESNWDSALQIEGEPNPQAPGSAETMTSSIFDPDRSYVFAMKQVDDKGAWSEISNTVELGYFQYSPPQAINDLDFHWTVDCSLHLTWSNVADDFPNESVSSYHVRVFDEMISETNWTSAIPIDHTPPPQGPGTEYFISLNASLLEGSEYFFAVKAVDEIGNLSTLSNVIHTRDPFWDTIADRSGIKIQTLVEYDGYLVAGGNFNDIGGTNAKNIARWDGNRWEPMGAGLGVNSSSNVQTLMIDFDGSLVAGGLFDKRGDGTGDLNSIVRWNGNSWQAIGEGFNGKVAALANYQGHLVAAGTFGTSGGVSVKNIASWDGISWQALGSGLTAADTDDRAYCLVVHGNHLIVGGKFSIAGGISSPFVAAWNGSSWSNLSGTPDRVHALLSFNGKLFAGVAGSPEGVYCLDNSGWHLIGSTNGTVYDLGVYNGRIVAGGSFRKIGTTSLERKEVRFVATFQDGEWWPFCSMYGGTTEAYHVFSFGQYSGDLVTGQKRYVSIWDQQ